MNGPGHDASADAGFSVLEKTILCLSADLVIPKKEPFSVKRDTEKSKFENNLINCWP